MADVSLSGCSPPLRTNPIRGAIPSMRKFTSPIRTGRLRPVTWAWSTMCGESLKMKLRFS